MHHLIPIASAISVAPGAEEPIPLAVIATWLAGLAFLVYMGVILVRELRRPEDEPEVRDELADHRRKRAL